ncbi:DUF6922 domain-containing protein, partial [Acidobacteriota bacterium]
SCLNQIQRLFWDRKLEAEDFDAYPLWLVKRVLDYGNLKDVHVLGTYFGRMRLLEVIGKINFDSARTLFVPR